MAQRSSSLDSNVVYEYVYKGVKCGPHAGKLSALVVTSFGDVYGAGTNTLVRCFTYHDEYPMQEGGGSVLDNWVKIDHLSGLGIRKIVVGDGFGAAVTNENVLLTWGRGLITFLSKQAIIMFEVNGFGTECSLCKTPHVYEIHYIGRLPFNYCPITQTYPAYTEKFPPPEDVQVRRFLRARGETTINCPKCSKEMASMMMQFIPVVHCPSCNLLWDVDENVGFFEGIQEASSPRWGLFRLGGVEDISSQGTVGLGGGVWLLQQGNELKWKSVGKPPPWMELPVENPKNVKMSALCSGVVKTSTASVCRVLRDSRLEGDRFALEEIPMPAKVVKICCGLRAVVCLLEDQSIWVLFDGQPPKQLLMFNKDGRFNDVAAAHWSDTFYVQANRRMEINMNDSESVVKILFKVSEDDCRAVLLDAVCLKSIPIRSVMPQSSTSVWRHNSVPLPPFLVSLFGKKQLSDLTLKLPNGDFPAHRCVLLSTSIYFKKILFSNTDPHVTLDMSSYNSKAYECLLKYYYQHEPDDLGIDDLLDLYVIADSYEEIEIASDVQEKVLAKINTVNVLHGYGMSQMLNIEVIKTYCENLMRSSNFKEQLLEKALRDPMMFLLLLEWQHE